MSFENLFAASDDKAIIPSLIANYHKYVDVKRADSNCYDIVVLPIQSDTLLGINIGVPNIFWTIFGRHSPILKAESTGHNVSVYLDPSIDVSRFMSMLNADLIDVKSKNRKKHKPFAPLHEYQYEWCFFKFDKDGQLFFLFGTDDSPTSIKMPPQEIIESLMMSDDVEIE